MKNLANDIRVFKLSGESKNGHGQVNRIIVTAYSRSGVVNAWHGYSDQVIGRAGGGGYDKTNTAMASAAAWIVNEVEGVKPDIAHYGSSGFAAVRDALAAIGWQVEQIV